VASSPIMDSFERGRLLFDGAMGSMLIAQGLETGWPPEEWNVSHPEIVCAIHHDYLNAGAQVIGANTFGGTRDRLDNHALGDRAAEFNASGVRIARDAVARFHSARPDAVDRYVAFSVGPGGGMLPPVGTADEEQFRVAFVEQLQGIPRDDAPDLVLVETMLDIREALIALEASKRVLPDVPVCVSLTYNRHPRGFFTVMGDEASAAATTLAENGADAIAANCSIASGHMVQLGRLLREHTQLPILCQPNAGSPGIRGGKPVYEQDPEEYAADTERLFASGVNAVGGCCGTTPEFIRCAATRIGQEHGQS